MTSGVHALAQTAHLDVKTVLAPEVIRMKLNEQLPADINILEVEKAPPAFHARHDAVARSYLYQISRRRTALGKRFVWWVNDIKNLRAMRDASQSFVGMKDFQSFTDDEPEEKSTKVLVEDLRIQETGDLILIRAVGSHFLWKLVRRLVGTVVEVGRGRMSPKDLEHFLTVKSPEPAHHTAPASGLFLERVYYTGDIRIDTFRPVIEVSNPWRRTSLSP
jgi:tRNA pseudouridine38-40 synthase